MHLVLPGGLSSPPGQPEPSLPTPRCIPTALHSVLRLTAGTHRFENAFASPPSGTIRDFPSSPSTGPQQCHTRDRGWPPANLVADISRRTK